MNNNNKKDKLSGISILCFIYSTIFCTVICVISMYILYVSMLLNPKSKMSPFIRGMLFADLFT